MSASNLVLISAFFSWLFNILLLLIIKKFPQGIRIILGIFLILSSVIILLFIYEIAQAFNGGLGPDSVDLGRLSLFEFVEKGYLLILMIIPFFISGLFLTFYDIFTLNKTR